MKMTPLFEWRGEPCLGPLSRALGLLLSLASGGFAAAVQASGAAATAAPEQWQSIQLESDCFGCPSGRRLTLLADGQVTLTLLGKARHGTQDSAQQARLPAGAFERLARQLREQGFAQWRETYEVEDLRDGAWTSLEVQGLRLGQTFSKSVFARDEAAPAEMKRAIEALHRAAEELGLR